MPGKASSVLQSYEAELCFLRFYQNLKFALTVRAVGKVKQSHVYKELLVSFHVCAHFTSVLPKHVTFTSMITNDFSVL